MLDDRIARAVRVAGWDPDAATYAALLALLEPGEQARNARFRRRVDALRSLVGCLLIRTLLAEANGLRGPIAVPRDAANRPVYAAGPWQFNVSHHGDYVVLAAHAARPVGVDVMDCERPQPGTTTAAFLGSLRAQLSAAEWAAIHAPAGAADADETQLRRLYRLWTLKESYAKATGMGLGLALATLEFAVAPDQPPDAIYAPGPLTKAVQCVLVLDGTPRPEWTLELAQLDDEHVVAVACGPPGPALSWTFERWSPAELAALALASLAQAV